MNEALLALQNIGPKTADWLTRIGVASGQDLRDRGAVETYLALIDAGYPENLNALWALEGAVQERDFVDIANDERERLLTELAAAREWHAID